MAVVKIAKSLRRSLKERIANAEEITLLRPADVVQLTGFSKSEVYRLIACGDMPCVRKGRSVRVPVPALRKWVAQNTHSGSALSPVSQPVA